MFKNILLPLDGSPFSETAQPLATEIARKANAQLHIVRVHAAIPNPVDVPIQPDVDEMLRDKEREHLDRALQRAHAAGVAATSELLEGPVYYGLETYADETGIDLIVMTTHGRSGISRAVLGSVAAHCVRTTHVPVLLLHPAANEKGVPRGTESVKRILVALDGSPESEGVIDTAVEMARLTGSSITLVQVVNAPFDIAVTLGSQALQEYLRRARDQVMEYLNATAERIPDDVTVDTLAVSDDRAASGIVHAQEQTSADMIVMATSGRSGWARIAIGSVAEAVLHKAAVPVLMLRPAALTGRNTKNMAGTAPSTK